MHGCYVTNNPGFRRMALFTIFSKGLIVRIVMAIKTIPSSIFKCERKVTILAIDYSVLTNQLKICIVVVKFDVSGINFPATRSMTLGTIDTKGFPMR
jgi:hypothetical protein